MNPSPNHLRITRSSHVGSRRRLGKLGLVMATATAIASPRLGGLAAAQREAGDDVALLNTLLSIEYLEVALMEGALLDFGAADWRGAGASRDIGLDLEEIRDQEQAHVAALAQAIADAGGTPVEPVEYAFGYVDADGFFRVAAGVADTVVAAYAGALPLLAEPTAVTTAIGIHSVEARHAGFLALAATESPFPQPIDQPLTRDEVVANLAGYTRSGGASETDPGEPAGTVADARSVFAAVIADAADRVGIDPDEIE
ncbi:MAG: ferritin-like domain-containing protein, partial [Chloroflexia bacterium]|nr:ferritin-like domain-containing protein [Chloroflexia bacterium]